MERLNLLAHLISDGILDIRIAYTDKDNEIGMYHEKMGILEDKDGNHVAFSGSMNESMTAMSINYETIDVFCDWREAEADRVLCNARRKACGKLPLVPLMITGRILFFLSE